MSLEGIGGYSSSQGPTPIDPQAKESLTQVSSALLGPPQQEGPALDIESIIAGVADRLKQAYREELPEGLGRHAKTLNPQMLAAVDMLFDKTAESIARNASLIQEGGAYVRGARPEPMAEAPSEQTDDAEQAAEVVGYGVYGGDSEETEQTAEVMGYGVYGGDSEETEQTAEVVGYGNHGGGSEETEQTAEVVGYGNHGGAAASEETEEAVEAAADPDQLDAVLSSPGLAVEFLGKGRVIVMLKSKAGHKALGGAFKQMKPAMMINLFDSAVKAEGVAYATMIPHERADFAMVFDNEREMSQLVQQLGEQRGIVSVHTVKDYTSKTSSDQAKVGVTMEYCAGGSVDHKMATMSYDEAATAFEGVFYGLGTMHREGIIHFDGKPGNAFLTAEGEGKVGDFGCARKVGSYYLEGDSAYKAPEIKEMGNRWIKAVRSQPEYVATKAEVRSIAEKMKLLSEKRAAIESDIREKLTEILGGPDHTDDGKLLKGTSITAVVAKILRTPRNAEAIQKINKLGPQIDQLLDELEEINQELTPLVAERKSAKEKLQAVEDKLKLDEGLRQEHMAVTDKHTAADVYGWALALEETLKARAGGKEYPTDVPDGLQQLIAQAKDADPDKRPTADDFYAFFSGERRA